MGKFIDKVSDVMFVLLVVILTFKGITETLHYAYYGVLFDFRPGSLLLFIPFPLLGFGGCYYLGQMVAKARARKAAKCCLTIQQENRNAA